MPTIKPLPSLKLAAKPFVKWAGGKSQLLEQFGSIFPKDFENYIEPMVGGGAVFFYLFNTDKLKNKVFLIDINQGLMNCYEVIKSDVEVLIPKLKELEAAYSGTPKETYYEVRRWDRQKGFANRSKVERAARTIFLNRTCYNGLYRVNSKGQFNVPIGKYKNPTICDEENLRAVNRALQNVQLFTDDFEKCLELASHNDFIYFDPPYYPLNDTANFTSYTKGNFSTEDQKRLKNTFKELAKMGCKVMLSNSDTEFIRKLHQGFKIHTVHAKRRINSNSDGRGEISEVVVTNYKT